MKLIENLLKMIAWLLILPVVGVFEMIKYLVKGNQLCTYADEECENSQLPVPVRFFMDDFATNCRIDNFENMVSNIRSRKISVILVLQSLSQLDKSYGQSAHTIVDDCDTLIYMGGNDSETAHSIAIRCNKTTQTILHMPLCSNWIFRRGEKPFFM